MQESLHLWHALEVEKVLSQLEVDLDFGLSEQEVEERLQTYGRNQLSGKKGKSSVLLFLEQFNQALIYILISACLVTAYLGEWLDCSVIFAVIMANAIIGFVQESKAIKAINSLANSLSCEAVVLRSGSWQNIMADSLVPGDIISLTSGDKVPADVRLFDSTHLLSDESMLSGEPLPAAKQVEILDKGTILSERDNMLYSGTYVTGGQGRAIVVETGHKTEIGKISDMINTIEPLDTPLTRKISQFSAILMYFILTMAVITFVVGYWHGKPLTEMFMASVALAVGAIPEGLPAVVTITLAIGTGRMAAVNAIIRRLPAVESLGSTTVICSDKTGTLTQNCMTVEKLYTGGELTSLADNKEISLTELQCLKIGILCNDCKIQNTDDIFNFYGDPTEKALIYGALRKNVPVLEVLESERVESIPFDSKNKYMATIYSEGDKFFLYVKGSFEHIAPFCSKTLENDGSFNAFNEKELAEVQGDLASEGMRVLAFAQKEIDHSSSLKESLKGLVFVGFQAMIDPPREEVLSAVDECRSAGVKVVMITGDHPGTAEAIARKVGIISESGEKVMTGKEFNQLSQIDKVRAVSSIVVFARVEPMHKMEIVEILQEAGEIVAMTGDGVNDALALRRADIGIAMGKAGTEVARDSSDMVLADDNFASISAAVKEGRGIYDNLVKFITWTLPTNLAEGLVIMVAVLYGATLPILPVQILWINMSTALLLGLMLAFEPKEGSIMSRSPNPPNQGILSKRLVLRVFIVGFLLLGAVELVFYYTLSSGGSTAVARTAAANMLVIGELCYLFNCRSLEKSLFSSSIRSNLLIPVGALLMFFLQLLFTYLNFMNQLFHTASLKLSHWALISLLGIVLALIVEIEKKITVNFK